MITSKHLGKLMAVLIGLSLIISGLLVLLAQSDFTVQAMAYEDKLFGTEILTIDIKVNEDDWQSMLTDPTAKAYIPADLTINGEVFSSVGLRTKGNSSLSQVARMSNSNRYSLHIKFNKYEKGQTYYGLDSFSLNNMIGDNTYMKDYLAYDLMNFIGVPTPLLNYAQLTINDEDFGFYLALERYEKAFLERVYNSSGGQLYNVKNQMGLDNKNQPAANRQENFRGQAGGGGRPGGQNGGSLLYTDDEISSYSSIFTNAEFKSNSDKDKQRVIKALKNLNEGTDLEKYFDLDEILRYLAAHTVLVNLDSYSSSMAQNYYIYEKDGKISTLPWDYNLAFGAFQSSSATDTINFPIDTPVSGVEMADRPLISKLLAVPEYLDQYHTYLAEIVEGYFNSGLFTETISALDAKINAYVKSDATAFISYEQYTTALPVLVQLGELRAQSIAGQLDGSIPATTAGQNSDQEALISGAEIDLALLGSFMGGQAGQKNNNNADNPGPPDRTDRTDRTDRPDQPESPPDWQDNSGFRPPDRLDRQDNAAEMPDESFAVFPGNQAGQLNPGGSQDSTALGLTLVLLGLTVGAILFLAKYKKSY